MPPFPAPVRTATRLVPVLDLLGPHVVRAVGGRRQEYRPIRSSLTPYSEPKIVAEAMIAATGADRIYVADLDGIVHGEPNHASLLALAAVPVRLLLDVGIRSAKDLRLEDSLFGRVSLIVGTETVAGPREIAELQTREAVRGVVLSLDLFDGQFVGDAKAWGVPSGTAAEDVVNRAVNDLGIREVIVLDIARVGRADGTGTERLLARLSHSHPAVHFLAGGGVRGWNDYHRLIEAGAAGVLASTAIHDGTLRSAS